MPVAELLARTPSHELTEWAAYEKEYGPLGPERGDWHAAEVAHTVALAAVGKKGRRLKLSDFLLKWGSSKKERQTPEQMLAVLQAFADRQEMKRRDPR